MKSFLFFMLALGLSFRALVAQDGTPVRVACTVLSWKDEPVEGAEVKLMLRPNFNQDTEKGEMLATGLTDAAGIFRVSLPTRGKDMMNYGAVLASKPGAGVGGSSAFYIMAKESKDEIQLSVKLHPPAECHVRLLKQDGSPAAGVRLWVDQCTMPDDERGFMFKNMYVLPDLAEVGWHGITDKEGRCVIPNLPREAYLYLRHDAEGLAQLPGRYMMHFKDAPRAMNEESEHRLVAGGGLRGRITGPNGEPVKGGAVYLLEETPYITAYGEQLRVDAEGRFEFRQVPPSSYKLQYRCLKQDEDRWIGDEIKQQPVQAGQTTDLGDLKLSPTAIVTARVLDAETGKEIEEPILFHLKAGSHQLRYRSERYPPDTHLPPGVRDSIPVQVAAGERKSIEFRLMPQKPENIARGQVLDEAGKPVAGAMVQLLGDHDNGLTIPNVCDEAGKFKIVRSKLAKSMSVLAWTESGISDPVELQPGGEVTVPLQSKGLASIHGVIRDEKGRPIKDASFQIECGLDFLHDGPLKAHRQVEADGRFVVSRVPRSVKEVALFAYAEGYAQAALRDHPLKLGEAFEWNPVLKETREFVEGIVVDKKGAGVAAVEIRVGGDGQPSDIKPVRTDAQGRFRVSRLAAGALHVTAKHKTADFTRDTWIRTKAPQSGLRLVLPDADGRVSGVVLDHTGKPVAGAEVESYSHGRKTTADQSGHFILTGLEFGWLRLQARTQLSDGTRLSKEFRAKTGMQQLKLTLPATADDSNYVSAAAIDLTGKPAPEIHVATWIDCKPIAAKAGGKVRILDFWGMECAPCLAGFPKLQKFWEQHQQEVELLALGSGFYPEQEVREYLQRHPELKFPIALGEASEKDATAYQVRGIPTYVVIGKNGRILSSGHDWEQAAATALKAAKE